MFHRIHQFQGQSAFKTWLYKIVHNFCRSRIPKIIRKREFQEAYKLHLTDSVKFDLGSSTSAIEKSDQVRVVMEKIRPKERELIIYKFILGMTLREMSEITGISASAAKIRYLRALQSFR